MWYDTDDSSSGEEGLDATWSDSLRRMGLRDPVKRSGTRTFIVDVMDCRARAMLAEIHFCEISLHLNS